MKRRLWMSLSVVHRVRQDLSIAGKREGLAGARSGLFMEQIRLVKEMRDADRLRGRTGQLIRPRFVVWENVPGAFSSNKGEDFRAVLEEFIRIAEPGAPDVPLPAGGRWPLADAWYGDGWSVAYRVLDAQFWGVPQRRRRIALVADFGGQAAPEILFERKGLRWDSAEGGEAGETAAGAAEDGAYPAVARSLTARYDGSPCIDRGPNIVCTATQQGGAENRTDDKASAITAATYMGGNSQTTICAGFQPQAGGNTGMAFTEGVAPALVKSQQAAVLCAGFKWHQGAGARDIGYKEEVSPTLSVEKNPAVVYCEVKEDDLMQMLSAKNDAPTLFENHGQDSRLKGPLEVSPTVSQKWGTGGNNTPLVMESSRQKAEIYEDKSPTIMAGRERPIIATNMVERFVRRLTPLECERLQGFPDGWTDIGEWTDSKGKKRQTSDAARYKALGNSIALPPWKWVLKRLCACYERDATMASLFDGIGGFPLLWEQLNGPGSCRWASEIEEFPMAVTRRRLS